MKKLFFLVFGFVFVLLSCNTNPGVTLADLERRDSVMLVMFDSVIERKFERAGMYLGEIDSTSFVLDRAAASAVFERVIELERKLAGLEVSSSHNGLNFPKGGRYFTSFSGDRYRMFFNADEDRGIFWINLDKSQPGSNCVIFEMSVTFSVDASSGKARAYYAHGSVSAYNTCSQEQEPVIARDYLESITRQVICPPNWMLGEFEQMLEEEPQFAF